MPAARKMDLRSQSQTEQQKQHADEELEQMKRNPAQHRPERRR